MKRVIAFLLSLAVVISVLAVSVTASAGTSPEIWTGNAVIDFEHGEILRNSTPCILASNGQSYPINSWSFDTPAANSVIDGTHALRIRCTDDSVTGYRKVGAYPLNNGRAFYYLTPCMEYEVSFDLKIISPSDAVRTTVELGYSPVYNGSSAWSQNGISSSRVLLATIAEIPASATEYTYTSEDGVNATGVIDGKWVRHTVKFTAPETFPEPSADYPLSDVLCITGTWARGTDIAIDNIVIKEPDDTAVLVYENGEKEVVSGSAGTKIEFDRAVNTDKTYPSGNGNTVLSCNWYTDKDCTEEVDYNNTFISAEQKMYYAKCVSLIPETLGKTFYYGFEDGISTKTLPQGFAKINSGYNSKTSVRASGTTGSLSVTNAATLIDSVTYNIQFRYKAENKFTLYVNGNEFSVNSAADWTECSVAAAAVNGDIKISVNSTGKVYFDTFVGTAVDIDAGVSVLTDKAENIQGSQAMRMFFNYASDNDGNVILAGKKYSVTERGVVISGEEEKDLLTVNSENAVVITKSDNFSDCWAVEEGKTTYSIYAVGFKKDDDRVFTYRGYIKLSDGNTYYSVQSYTSVNHVKSVNTATENSNEYSLTDESVRDKIQFSGRYTVTDYGVSLNHTDSSAEFKAITENTVTVKLNISDFESDDKVDFALYVDGILKDEIYTVTRNTYSSDDYSFDIQLGSRGEHTVKLLRLNEEEKFTVSVSALLFDGELLTNETANGTMIEFIGDENFTGYSFTNMVGKNLGCDIRTFAYKGLNLVGDIGYAADTNYEYEQPHKNDSEFICQRQADVVCIYFDPFVTLPDFEDTDIVSEKLQSLISKVKDRSPKAKIILLYDTNYYYKTCINNTVDVLGGSASNVYAFSTGMEYSLTYAAQKTLAEKLSEYIKDSGFMNAYKTLIIEKRNDTWERKTRPVNFTSGSSYDELTYYTPDVDPSEKMSKLPKGTVIFEPDKLNSQTGPNNGSGNATFTKISINNADVPFSKGLRVKFVPDDEGNEARTMYWNIFKNVPDNDWLLIRFYARSIEGEGEAQTGNIGFLVEETGEAGHWNKILNQNVTVDTEWKEYYLPFQYKSGYPVLFIRWSNQEQVVEIAGLTITEYTGNFTLSDFPNTTSTSYLNEDAEWRTEAFERIDEIRKGNIAVTVKDKFGNRIENADISVEMYEHEFQWGNCTFESFLTDTKSQKYLVKYFNSVVIGNNLKWGFDPNLGVEHINMVNKIGIQRIRGHCLVWDGEGLYPQDIVDNVGNEQYVRAAVKERINSMINLTRNRLVDWDVLNEACDLTYLQDAYGKQMIKEWYDTAKAANSGAKLYYNDFVTNQRLFDLLDTMTEMGVPFDGIGIQSHYGGANDPRKLYDLYTRLSKYGKSLKITEFDMQCNDPEVQASFVRDFMITAFSCEAMEGFYFWGLSGGESNLRVCFDNYWNPRPALSQISDLIYNKFCTNEYGTTDSNGEYSCRGFYGAYKISAVVDGVKKTVYVDCFKGNENTVEITF